MSAAAYTDGFDCKCRPDVSRETSAKCLPNENEWQSQELEIDLQSTQDVERMRRSKADARLREPAKRKTIDGVEVEAPRANEELRRKPCLPLLRSSHEWPGRHDD